MNSNGNTPTAEDWATMPEWLSTEEAVQLSGFHPEYIRELARAGKIGAVKKGRDWWIDRDLLREYLDAMAHLGPQKFIPHSIAKSEGE